MPGLRKCAGGLALILRGGLFLRWVWLGVLRGGLRCGGGLCCERLCREGSGTVLEDPPVVGYEPEGATGGTAGGGVEPVMEGMLEGVA